MDNKTVGYTFWDKLLIFVIVSMLMYFSVDSQDINSAIRQNAAIERQLQNSPKSLDESYGISFFYAQICLSN